MCCCCCVVDSFVLFGIMVWLFIFGISVGEVSGWL